MSDVPGLVKTAMANYDEAEFTQLLTELVGIPSPTGDELQIATYAQQWLRRHGVEGRLQAIDDRQANAYARVAGSGPGGADLMLYAPLDTHLAGDPAEDVPGVGDALPEIYRSAARVQGHEVAGLGAENPKAFVACVMTAGALVAAQPSALIGDLMIALGAGGMPVNRRPGSSRAGIGHGAGVAHMLEQGFRPDYAVIAKPVWQVSWEEAGLTWFRIRVKGLYGYAGLRHLVPYRNAIDAAALVIRHLEGWFPTYSAEHEGGAVLPQGVVSAVSGGWDFKPAFTPAVCDVFVDLRVHPDDSPTDVKRVLNRELDRLRAEHPGLELETKMLLSIPGTRTDPDSWVVRSCIRAWEAMEGRQHVPLSRYSGSTDANVLRQMGVPTARIGVPQRAGQSSWAGEDSMPMNLVDVRDCRRLVELLVTVAYDTCIREVEETRS